MKKLSDMIRERYEELQVLNKALEASLPQEPGRYVDCYMVPWELAPNGYWYHLKYGNDPHEMDLLKLFDRLPFRRVEPNGVGSDAT